MTRPVLLAVALALALGLGCQGPRTRASGEATLTSGEASLTSGEAPPSPPALARAPDVASLVEKVSPSVVNITATQELRVPTGVDPFEFFFGGQGPHRGGQRGGQRGGPRDEVLERRGVGSGFILDPAGHVVTNAHVVENASTVRVKLSDEREFEAKVRGRDERLDLAVLALEGAKDLPHAALGQSEQLRVGEYVVAIGNPFGLGNTVTMGIVSAKGRELGAGPYDDFVQTDASINPGNSGGPLFDLKGEVVGISTAIVPAGQGIGFAIPVDAFKDVLPQLLTKGSVSRGRLGVAIQTLDAPLAKALGLDKPTGALVGEVEPSSPAAKAGIKPGDVIVQVDQTPIVRGHDLPRLIARRAPGTKAAITLARKGGATRKVDVTLDELREQSAEQRSSKDTRPSPEEEGGLELGDDPRGGVVVRGVAPGSAAAEALEPGDVIVEVNGAPVTSSEEAAARIRETKPDRPTLLKVSRNGRTGFVALVRK